MMNKDVHTEHCCVFHGCKYGDDDCTVFTRAKRQSYPCERCGDLGMNASKEDLEISVHNFHEGEYFKLKQSEDQSPALLYVMGHKRDAAGTWHLIADIRMCSSFVMTGGFDFVSSIQGVKAIKKSEWERISKETFEELNKVYVEQFKTPPEVAARMKELLEHP